MTTTISDWSAISALGLGRPAFAAAVRARGTAAETATPPDPGRARLVPRFEIREVLGRGGTRTMDRVTALAVATAGHLVGGTDGERRADVGNEAALVLGTNISSAKSSMDFARDTLTQAKPFFVDAGRFPNAVLNCAAAQCGIRHTLRGPNATISGGRATGLLALNYARRLQRSGRAGAVLCGAVEEFSAERAWLEGAAAAPGALLGEGCAMFLLAPEKDDRPGLAEVLAVEFSVCAEPAGAGAALGTCVDRAFTASGESPADLWAIAGSGGAAEDDVLAGHPAVRLRSTDLVGDTHAASAAFALAAVLALAESERTGDARTALVTAVDRDGVVGCALLRLPSAGDTR
ncbi:3-oxoacyl-ACP synthase [Actinomadura spongiicola]|uniref:3-oxoacyl-ACP synthase n=1 Tax=Actinomadura spongiicola TaxID=2303421 RepID=A0A372GG29_9ACTN|nr:beta-ketoacyl synthase N-terminal-like domain-containing protein [Actinomadura spongiicola]RFS84321.1 3-oxoacyl-ACP synthase [Actinomadura spongiicola]